MSKYCMTTEEAKEKWCPISETMNCGADGCMAWRWVETHIGDGKDGALKCPITLMAFVALLASHGNF